MGGGAGWKAAGASEDTSVHASMLHGIGSMAGVGLAAGVGTGDNAGGMAQGSGWEEYKKLARSISRKKEVREEGARERDETSDQREARTRVTRHIVQAVPVKTVVAVVDGVGDGEGQGGHPALRATAKHTNTENLAHMPPLVKEMRHVNFALVTISDITRASFGNAGFCFPTHRSPDLTIYKLFCVVGVPFVVSTDSVFGEFAGSAPKLVWIQEYCQVNPAS